MQKTNLIKFLLKARTKTYAGKSGKARPALKGSKQLEYKEKEWLYRDIYFGGNGIFFGVETIYFKKNPVWGMTYYGDFKKMTEEEIDAILRKALIKEWKTARTWNPVRWKEGKYEYICAPTRKSSIETLSGTERILKNKKEVYIFTYTGGILTEV